MDVRPDGPFPGRAGIRLKVMKTKSAYWACQTIGWGSYVAVGLWAATRAVGWRPSVIVGYVLFYGYSIALTDLLRREIRRRQWLDASSGLVFGRMALAVIAIGMVQTFLIVSVTLILTGKLTQLSSASPLISIWVSVTGADSAWAVFYVAVTGAAPLSRKRGASATGGSRGRV